jgi:hypothetical protein
MYLFVIYLTNLSACNGLNNKLETTWKEEGGQAEFKMLFLSLLERLSITEAVRVQNEIRTGNFPNTKQKFSGFIPLLFYLLRVLIWPRVQYISSSPAPVLLGGCRKEFF